MNPYVDSASETKSRRLDKAISFRKHLLSIAILTGPLWFLCFPITAYFVVEAAASSVVHGNSRSNVKAKLFLFHEEEWSPEEFQRLRGESRLYGPEKTMVGYRFIFCPLLEAHVVYDQNGRVEVLIPTYE